MAAGCQLCALLGAGYYTDKMYSEKRDEIDAEPADEPVLFFSRRASAVADGMSIARVLACRYSKRPPR